MTSAELDDYLGFPQHPLIAVKKVTIVERKEPTGPAIVDYGNEIDYVQTFYDKYVKIKEQTWNSHKCFFPDCGKIIRDANKLRVHHLTH